jgi:hypothetical protein
MSLKQRANRAALALAAVTVIVVAAVHLTGNPAPASAPVIAAPVDPASLNNTALCLAWRANKTPALTNKLDERRVLIGADRIAAERGEVYVGMSADAVTCALGLPDSSRSVETASAHRVTETFRRDGQRPLIVTYRNGTVTAVAY